MRLNSNQRARVANILTDTGKIIFAASVIAPMFQGANISYSLILAGTAISVSIYLIAIYLEKED